MDEYKFIKEAIEKYGLKPTSQREVTLISTSCIALGYIDKLKDVLGLSYEATGFIGKHGSFHSMFNEAHIIDETEKLLKKEKHEEILAKARKLFNKIKDRLTITDIKTLRKHS